MLVCTWVNRAALFPVRLQKTYWQLAVCSHSSVSSVKDYSSSLKHYVFVNGCNCAGCRTRKRGFHFISRSSATAATFSFSSRFSFRRTTSPCSYFPRIPVPTSATGQCYRTSSTHSHSRSDGMDLADVVKALKQMASPSLAGSWDNVGLLVEPSPPHSVSKLLLTNDLTPQVLQEAVDRGAHMIVSYHPPIFAPLKRVTQGSWKERLVGGLLERRIALYSPHTSWDAVDEGVNDWLISAFDMKDTRPIEQTEETVGGRNKKLTFWTSSASAKMVSSLPYIQQNHNTVVYTEPVALNCGEGDGPSSTKVCVQCSAAAVPSIVAALQRENIDVNNMECCDLAKLPRLGHGMGRVGQLRSPISVQEAVSAVKKHLNLQHVRLAKAEDKEVINSVAVCAGSGASVLHGVKADLLLTGEMSHHAVLDAVVGGTHVVLCDHSNTERGYLSDVVRDRLRDGLGGKVEVMVSLVDSDPLVVV